MCGNINVYFLTIKYRTILINESRHVKLFTDPLGLDSSTGIENRRPMYSELNKKYPKISRETGI